MSQHFSAEQYDQAYRSKCLSQWEVPKKFRENPPRREGYTIPIKDENGHFSPHVMKPLFKEWSSYSGTWGKDYPKPKAVLGDKVKPGIWLIRGGRARWVSAQPQSHHWVDG